MAFEFIKVPAFPPRLTDSKKIAQLYSHWRLRSLYATFVGYAAYYFCRKNLSAATPALIADLGYSKTQIGTLWSILYLTYGVAKFINGVLGDRANSRYFMALGLLLSAIMNIIFGMSSALWVLGIAWGLNGWFQSMGGPTSARIMTHWFSPNELGTKWGFWNISHQIGGGFILILAGWLTQNYGWRSAFYVPAVLAIAVALFLVDRLRDVPEAMGLPPVEEFRNDNTGKHAPGSLDRKAPVRDLLLNHIFRNRTIWLLAIANFFVYLVRYGAMDWAPTYLVEVKGSTIANASFKTSLLEFLGIAGSLLAGWVSDKYFPRNRSIINVLYMGLLIFAVLGFWLAPAQSPILDSVLLGAVGFLVYGPQMMVGVCAAEAAGKQAAGTANGMTGFFGYMGSILSGIGTGYAVERFGWSGGFLLFVASAVIGMLLFILASRPAPVKGRI